MPFAQFNHFSPPYTVLAFSSAVTKLSSGGSRGGARPPLFLDQTEARRAEKKMLGETVPPLPPISRSGSGTAIKQNFMTFKDRLLNSMTFQVRKMKCLNSMTFQVRKMKCLNSMTFQVRKMKCLNSMTFQVFYDLYEPCNKRECQPSSLIGTCLTLPNLGFLWVFFK